MTSGGGGDFFCSSVDIVQGTLVSGDHTSAHVSDDVYLITQSVLAAQNKHWIEEVFTFSTGLSGLSSLDYTIEGHHDNDNAITFDVYAWKYSTSDWVKVDTFDIPTGTSDTIHSESIPDPADYISGGEVKLRFIAKKGQTWQFSHDFLKITAQP